MLPVPDDKGVVYHSKITEEKKADTIKTFNEKMRKEQRPENFDTYLLCVTADEIADPYERLRRGSGWRQCQLNYFFPN
jgi:hypothetical protein